MASVQIDPDKLKLSSQARVGYKLTELRNFAGQLGLKKSGSKDDLVVRLITHLGLPLGTRLPPATPTIISKPSYTPIAPVSSTIKINKGPNVVPMVPSTIPVSPTPALSPTTALIGQFPESPSTEPKSVQMKKLKEETLAELRSDFENLVDKSARLASLLTDIKRRYRNKNFTAAPIYQETIAYDDEVQQKMRIISQRIEDVNNIDPNDISSYEDNVLLIRLSKLSMV